MRPLITIKTWISIKKKGEIQLQLLGVFDI